MRVIGGEFRSRRLKSAPGLEIRPTPDRLREALFNVLAPRIGGTVFVDAYAGTGAVGIEALSRGAVRAVFIERSRVALAVLRDNLQSLGLDARCEVVRGKVRTALERVSGDIVFLDPPYDAAGEYASALDILGTRPATLVIVQHAARQSLEARYGALVRKRILGQGDNSLSFYELSAIPETEQRDAAQDHCQADEFLAREGLAKKDS